MLRRLWLRAVVGGFLVATVGVGLPVTVSAQTASVINACVNRTTGIVRIVPDGTNCQRNETSYRWNVQGPAGPAGGTGLTVIAEGSGGFGTELTERDNYLYAGPEFTPDRPVHCSVSVTASLQSAGGRDPQQPSFEIAVNRNGGDGGNPLGGLNFPNSTQGGEYLTLFRHGWFDISNDQTTRFGAYIGPLTGDWLSPWCQITVQYVCFER